jgi:hypothetical protein
VDLDISRGAVTARLQAETEQARELLSSEVDRLRSMLEHRGLRVERIEITSGRAERETPADPDGRGGWRTPAEDSPRDGGREAADDGSPGSGDRHRAWGGGPPEHAERDRPEKPANRAEPGAALSGAWIGSSPWRSHGSGVIRLDTLA